MSLPSSTSDGRGSLRILDLGRRPYREVWDLQRALVERVGAGDTPETLILVEHEPVVTIGRGLGLPDAEAETRFPVLRVERGGGVTYHGPGQLVGYPIVRLDDRDVRGHLRRIENGLVALVARYGLEGRAREGLTGLWVGERKVASIGVAVRRWVTWHGFALNVSTDLAGFEGLSPCGLDAAVMTSLEALAGRTIPLAQVAGFAAEDLARALGREPAARERGKA